MTALYPGSFDPPTCGHLDIIQRSTRLFGHVVIAILQNPQKKGCFPVEQRIAMLEKCLQDLPNTTVVAFSGLTTELARHEGAVCMIRGLRAHGDFDSEWNLAAINRKLAPDIETVFLPCSSEMDAVSSSAVRELASYGKPLDGFVPDEIKPEITNYFSARQAVKGE